MEVILKADVKALGKKGELVKTSDGYARNYLFPRGLAEEANAENMNVSNSRQAAAVHRKEEEIKAAKELKTRLEATVPVIYTKAGANGKLFGTITSKEIAESLKEQHGLDVDKKKISLTNPIKGFGTFSAEVRLYPEIVATLRIEVKEQA